MRLECGFRNVPSAASVLFYFYELLQSVLDKSRGGGEAPVFIRVAAGLMKRLSIKGCTILANPLLNAALMVAYWKQGGLISEHRSACFL